MSAIAAAASPGADESDVEDVLSALVEVARDVVPPDPAAVRLHRDGRHGFDRDLWRRFGEIGWLSMLVPENEGGAGVDERASAVVARVLGSAGRLEPFVASGVIVPRWLAGFGGAAAELLEPVMAGTLVAAPAWQSEAGGPESQPLPVVAALEPDGVVLNGTAHWVPLNAPDVFVVAAAADQEALLLRVEPDTPGAVVHPQLMADGTRWARLEFTAARVSLGAVLARGEAAAAAVASGVDTAVIVVSAELLGLIERMVELTVDYLGSRRQFGQPIGAFQALQHKAVDAWVQLRLAEAAVTDALRRRVDAEPHVRARAASSAKSRASSAALYVGGQAVQMHGAIGFTDEYELAQLVNRGLVLASWLGNAATHIRRYAQLTAERDMP